MRQKIVLISLLTFILFLDNVYAYNKDNVSLNEKYVSVEDICFNNSSVTFLHSNDYSKYCPTTWIGSGYTCFSGCWSDKGSYLWKAPRFTSKDSNIEEKLKEDYGFFLPIYVESLDNISSQVLTSDNFTYTGQKYVVYYYLSSYNFWKTGSRWVNSDNDLKEVYCYYEDGSSETAYEAGDVSKCDRIEFSSKIVVDVKKRLKSKIGADKIERIDLKEYAYVDSSSSDVPSKTIRSGVVAKTYNSYDSFKSNSCFSNYCLTSNSIDLMNKYGSKTDVIFKDDQTFTISTKFFKNPENGYMRGNDSMIYNMFYFAFEITPSDPLPDKVCNVKNDKGNECSSKTFINNCDTMKVRVEDTSGYVSVKENGKFLMGDYYPNTVVTPGRSFRFYMEYIYTLNWEILDCYGSYCENKLKNKLISNYFSDVNAGTLESRLNDSVSSDYTFNGDGNFKDAGGWSCTGGTTLKDGHLTISCKYEIKNAYINIDTNYISYGNYNNNDRFINLGAYFYIPLKFEHSKFSWNIKTENLALAKLRNVLNNYNSTKSATWTINTIDNNDNKCYVNIDDGGGSALDNIVYRSVDTNIKEDDSDLKLYYLKEGSNWYNYFYDSSKRLNKLNFERIYNSFDNLNYSTRKLTSSKIEKLLEDYDTETYDKWNNIKKEGTSGLVEDGNYFESISTSRIHCKIGEFEEDCDNVK